MGIQGGSVLFGLLLVLAVFCHSGNSLQCYSCPLPTMESMECTASTNCTSNLDSCLIAKAGSGVYYRCWKFDDCSFKRISNQLSETQLKYHCCKKNLCNVKEVLENGGTTLSKKTILLLVTPFLAAAWSRHP
ncbi:CD59 glycoprotein [Saimiri boliviensis]|uniref:CD59 glycoprotein n=2 Tax=Saimiri TaxID=9520 RepID=CD59_SAISC|nr:CD59 glycoprotein [Saimiri boliviensis boliviensis]P47777.1 RecName: Full=CD59 glycoprotein; AltName: Full=MAC-inhibitory protein; Short=MAC-IP; AltName: Full=Membrane attack complex inhibition factor; Short=MACIF; AltName: Full=Protectin; AltName: CD_antigen=CD59; Flags: Precursor [Saimiri sciureus]AAA16747.1 complement regulatory protein [Saimiri sciureus]